MVGAIVRNGNSGLGNLSWDFFRHGVIEKCLIIPERTGEPEFPERFGDNIRIAGQFPFTDADIDWLLDGIDQLVCFETSYKPDVYKKAKDRGVKTFLMPMHEANNYFHGVNPDVWLCPSDLEYEMEVRSGEKVRINVPVDMKKLNYRKRDKAQVFVHNSGHGGIGGRNGTAELIKSLEYVDSPIELILRSQSVRHIVDDPRVDFRFENVKNYWDLYEEGDVFILPDKFAGLSMPLQEAFASGMAIITTNRNPLNKWLPKEMLIEVENMGNWGNVDMTLVQPEEIATTIDSWYDKDISKYSELGKKWGTENSWEVLGPKYKQIIEG